MGIQTSHAGSLPRPDHLIELNRRRMDGEGVDEADYAQQLHDATVDVVKRQTDIGITLPNDGEYGHAMGAKVDYGAWWSYIFTRLDGLGQHGADARDHGGRAEGHDHPRRRSPSGATGTGSPTPTATRSPASRRARSRRPARSRRWA